jgi:hypothetical protein
MLAALTTLMLAADQSEAVRVLSLPMEERRAIVGQLPSAERRALLESVPPAELLAVYARNAAALGTYSATMIRRERVGGRMLDAQTTELWVQPEPFAVSMVTVDGPGKGRRVLYSAALRKNQLCAKEPGLFGVFGGLWIDIDSGLTRRDSNHAVVELGLGSLVAQLERHFKEAASAGDFKRTFEGDADGVICERFESPPSKKRLYATSSLLCVDLALGLPVRVEITDADGPLEQHAYSDVKPARTLATNFFTPSAQGL